MMTGSEIKELRKSMGLTQVQLARELGVDHIAVSKWERGKHIISLKNELNLMLVDLSVKQADTQFALLKERIGTLTARDFLTSVLTLNDEEIKKYAKEGMIKTK